MEALYIAMAASIQVLALAGLNLWAESRKTKRDVATRATEKAAEWARQDLVAERAAKAAEQAAHAAALLVSTQVETIKRTDEAARLAGIANTYTQTKLDTIHKLVNSDMTAARTNERDQTVLTLLALKRVQALSASLGLPVDLAETQAIEAAERHIEELNLILADRLAAFQKAELEAKAAEAAGGTPSPTAPASTIVSVAVTGTLIPGDPHP